MSLSKTIVQRLLTPIQHGRLKVTYWDGTSDTFGRGQAVGTLTLNDERVLKDFVRNAEEGFVENYLNGRIDFDGRLHDLVLLAVRNDLTVQTHLGRGWGHRLVRGFTKATSIKEQQRDIAHHYDLGNDFYRLFLDPSMTYSCAYFRSGRDSLETAQQQKVDHTLKKLNLKRGEQLLDIGSGWGQLLIQAAKQYGVTAHGITLSKEQVAETTRRIKAEKLERRVSVALMDYRDLAKSKKRYDKVVSVGMFEHVGRPNLPVFLDTVSAILEEGGLLLLHSITKLTEDAVGSFTTKYIFPGGYIPSVRETIALLPDRNFRLLDAENLRSHYALTLDQWARNFERNMPKVKQIFSENAARLGQRWDGSVNSEKFLRVWRLYLEGSAANFRGGALELHQFLIGKGANNELPLTHEAWYQER